MLLFAYYLMKVIICSAVLYGYYWFFLRNKVFHRYNRFYLLATVVLSLTLPLLQFNVWQPANEPTTPVLQILQVVNGSDAYVDEMIIQTKHNHISKEQVALLLFIVACLLFTIIFLKTLLRIYALKKNNPIQQYNEICLIETEDKSTPFSFLKNIFWNRDIDINSSNGKRILKHEIAHVQELHSYDKLFLNTVLIFFWSNPVFWLMRRELNLLHEFLADKKAVEDGDTAAFAAMILQSTYPGYRFGLTNNFFYSPIKRRLAMLTKNKTKMSYISRLLALPLIVIVFAAFTLKAKKYIASLPENKVYTIMIDAGHGGTDKGAMSRTDGSYEKELTLALAKKIQALNTLENIKIILTRSDDISLKPQERTALAKKEGADLFISIHVDSEPVDKVVKGEGMAVFVSRPEFPNNAASIQLASAVLNSFRGNYGLVVPAVPQQRKSGIWVLQNNTCASVIIEAGFISNDNDRKYLLSETGKEKFASNVLNAIVLYIGATENSQANKPEMPKYMADILGLTAKEVTIKEVDTIPKQAADMLGMKDVTILKDAEFTFDEVKSNDKNHQGPVVINNRLYTMAELKHKKIVSGRALVFGKDNKKMTDKYGEMARNGIIVFEDAKIVDIIPGKFSGAISEAKNNPEADVSQRLIDKHSKTIRILSDSVISPSPSQLKTIQDPLYVVNKKLVTLRELKNINLNGIKSIDVLAAKEAIMQYGEGGKNGVVLIELESLTGLPQPSLTLNGKTSSRINVDQLNNITALGTTSPDYKVISATVYFSGAGFQNVVMFNLKGESVAAMKNYLMRVKAGTTLTFDNIQVAKKDGSGLMTIAGKSFTFFETSTEVQP